MIRTLPLLLSCLATALCAEPAGELLRFANGDQLHGRLAGIGEGGCLLWQRGDLNDVARFQTSNLRHAVLQREPQAIDPVSTSLVELINGDQLPGRITAIDRDSVSLETQCLGSLTIPLRKVTRISPQPTGGRIRYHGPFSATGWEILQPNLTVTDAAKPVPQAAVNQPVQAPSPDEDEQQTDNKKPASWRHNGASWYWFNGSSGTGLIRRNCLPENSLLRFELAWKNQLSLLIAIHADFGKLPAAGDKAKDANAGQEFMPGDSGSYPRVMGNAQVIQIHSNYIVVSRSVASPNGDNSHRLHSVSSRLRLSENSKARFELRSNGKEGSVSLFINDQYITQWSQASINNNPDKPLPPLGSGLAFYALSSATHYRISDMLISEWNGLPDAARSMQAKEHDIMLMSNGMDRYSGKLVSLEADGQLSFEGRHGKVRVPLSDVAEIQMAREPLEKAPETPANRLVAHLSPLGIVSGSPVSGDGDNLTIHNDLIGPVRLNTHSAILLEFNAAEGTYDDWDANF
ncbi:MAG TPA: hypothetical protein VFY13_07290 [Luteolibacter sp.]|nr:hypothetical protein [Luteolibacter sp.]